MLTPECFKLETKDKNQYSLVLCETDTRLGSYLLSYMCLYFHLFLRVTLASLISAAFD